jgi:hypothetical protein
MNMLVLLA